MVLHPVLLFAAVARASVPSAPVNGDFEQGAAGTAPPGWTRSDGGDAATTLETAFSGRQSVRLGAGGISQRWGVEALRGRRVRVQLYTQALPGAVGRVSLRASADGAPVWADGVEVRAPSWEGVALDVDLPDVAGLELKLALDVEAGGSILVDAVSLDDLGPVSPAGTAPLGADAADRIGAFSRLYSHVRWFHPADGVLQADWHELAVSGVEVAEATADPRTLAASLEELLAPWAPTVQVWSGPNPPPPLEPTPGDRRVAWHHEGAGVGIGVRDPESVDSVTEAGNAFRRFRVDSAGGHWSEMRREIPLAELDARAWSEQTVRLSATAEVSGDLDAVIVLSTPGGERRAATPSLRSGSGALLLEVPAGSDRLAVELQVSGEGAVELTSLEVASVELTPGRLVLARVGSTLLQVSLVGALALAGAAVSRRTIGGFLITAGAVLAASQLVGVDPTLAHILPSLHLSNLEAWFLEDARRLERYAGEFGATVSPWVSASVLVCWISGLIGVAVLRLRGMDVRGGGD